MNQFIDEEDSEDDGSQTVNGEMTINIDNIPISYPPSYSLNNHGYYVAEGILKEIDNKLGLLTKVDSSLIDKQYHKKFLKKELHKYLLRLNAVQLKTFMENHRTLLIKIEQMFKL